MPLELIKAALSKTDLEIKYMIARGIADRGPFGWSSVGLLHSIGSPGLDRC